MAVALRCGRGTIHFAAAAGEGLDELVAAYSALARGCILRRPRLVRRVVTADGQASESAAFPETRLLSERAAFWVADVLADPRARAWAFGSGGSLDFPFPVAVKTGTSRSGRGRHAGTDGRPAAGRREGAASHREPARRRRVPALVVR